MTTSNALRLTAWAQHQAGELVQAEGSYRELLQQGLKTGNIDERDAINLGGLLRQQGRLQDAKSHYQTCLPLLPNSEGIRLNAINALIESGDCTEALTICEDAISRIGGSTSLINAQGRILMRAGQFEQALACFEKLLKQGKREIDTLLNSGMALDSLERWPEALERFREASNTDPKDARPICNCLILLSRLGKFEEAEQLLKGIHHTLKKSLTVQTANANLIMQKGDYTSAEIQYKHLCTRKPTDAGHWLNRAACLKALKHNVLCSEVLKEGLKWVPEDINLLHAYGQSLAEMGRYAPAMECLLQSTEHDDQLNTNYVSNLEFIGVGYGLMSSEQLQAISQRWEEQTKRKGVGTIWRDHIHSRSHNRRLKVGYLSSDLNRHPVGRFLLPILKEHDHTSVEVYGLSTSQVHDEITQELKNNCDQWHDLQHRCALEVARQIADLQLDILVELGGFTSQSPIEVLVHRPSPIQLSYLGYCGPTYLQSIDGWIGDTELFGGLNTVDRDAHSLLNITDGYMAYVPETYPTIKEPDHTRLFRFGSFNHSRKLTDSSIDLFCSVLKACPKTELLLKSVSFVEQAERERTRQRFITAGLSSDRLVIEPWVEGWENHMHCYHGMDVALDALPYGGATTTCEALSMGVPVITLAGGPMVSRLSSSILMSAQHTEWIARTKEQYINIAKSMAMNPTPRTLHQRLRLRNELIQSPLGNGRRVSNELERLYFELHNYSAKH
tara:strand:+ start:2802 stop:4988 length:2187 start_codon:yes stop_codon:yes gene_type:complete